MSDSNPLIQIAKDIAVMRNLLSDYVNAQRDAESEVHEKLFAK
jgi:hypothetical protein